MKPWAKILVGFLTAFCLVVIGAFGYIFFLQMSQHADALGTYRARALQQEAKVNLKTLYSSQNTFRATYGTYTSDLSILGMGVTNRDSYKFGFPKAFKSNLNHPNLKKLNALLKDSDALDKIMRAPEEPRKYEAFKHITVEQMANYFCKNCHVKKDSFKAIAFGNLDDDDTWDVWTIDETGGLIHLSDDLKN